MFRLGIVRQRESWLRWQQDCVQAIEAAGYAAVALVMETDQPSPVQWPLGARAGREVAPGPALEGAATLRLEQPLDAAIRQAVAGHTLDLVLDLSGCLAGGSLPRVARHGVWSLHFGDPARAEPAVPGLGPVARGDAASCALLWRWRDDGAVDVLREGWLKTRQTPRRNADQLALRAARWPALVLGTMAETRDAPAVLRRIGVPPAGAAPSPATSLAAAARFAAYGFGSLKRRFSRERWSIGIVEQPIEAVIREKRLAPVRWIAGQPDDRFYADPFPFRLDGDRLSVLVETSRYRTAVGHLAMLQLDADRALLSESPVLETPHHLSYPYLLDEPGGPFVVPESWEADRLSAHRLAAGGRLERDHDLMTGRALVDGTLLRHAGRWYLFACDRQDDDTTNLHLFHAADWRGPFLPHPQNPVKVDVRSSRPAGRAVVVDGQLYRPAQDCALRYGNAIAMNRVVELDERRFREEVAFVLRPDPSGPFPDGLHTINGLGDLTVVDGECFSFEPLAALGDRRARRLARRRRQ